MKRFLLLALGLYAAYAIAMIGIHPKLLYPFYKQDVVLDGFTRIELAAEDGTQIALQESTGDGVVVLYFMGNAGALAAFGPPLQRHRKAGRYVIAMEYRGGAGRPGTPSEAILKSDALLVADWALAKGLPVVVHGYSLGTGLAVHVAKHRQVGHVILEAPYDRLCILMAQRSFLPACQLPGVQKWETLRDAPEVSAPVTTMHGRSDRVIPPERSVALVDAFPAAEHLVLDGGGHFDAFSLPAAQNAVEAIFEQLAQ